MELKRILAPIDFSDPSKRALREADRLAVEKGARLTVMYAQPLHMAAVGEVVYEHAEDVVAKTVVKTIREQLSEATAGLETASEQIVIKVRIGPVIGEIVDESGGHDLLVIASHGRTGLGRFLMGSVTERVVRASKCSVLVIKAAPPSKKPN